MIQTSCKKLVLEHLVVRKMGTGGSSGGGGGGGQAEGGGGKGLKQSELDDILR